METQTESPTTLPEKYKLTERTYTLSVISGSDVRTPIVGNLKWSKAIIEAKQYCKRNKLAIKIIHEEIFELLIYVVTYNTTPYILKVEPEIKFNFLKEVI